MRRSDNHTIDFTESILKHCLEIAQGKCSITHDSIVGAGSEMHGQILYGLFCMFEQLEFSKNQEEKRLQSEFDAKLLKEKNRELEQFAYKASHDLKEPIRTIFSFSQLLKNRLSESEIPKVNNYIDYIQISAKRMTDMITHLLEYARFGNVVEFKKVDTHTLLQNINFDLITQIQRTEGKLILNELPIIQADETMLRLLFQNAISNSLKFHREGVPPVVEISAIVGLEFVEFMIKDNGIGVPKKDIPKLFDIFKRVDLHTEQYEGTGIGLAHCKKIVEIHHGEIWMDSVLGEGSTIHFTIKNNLGLDQ